MVATTKPINPQVNRNGRIQGLVGCWPMSPSNPEDPVTIHDVACLVFDGGDGYVVLEDEV